jgi:hypothetical protein
MGWDADLEQLATLVHETLGDEAFNAAIGRAFSAVVHPSQSGEPSMSEGGMIASSDGRVFSTSTFYEAIRTEFERVLRRH